MSTRKKRKDDDDELLERADASLLDLVDHVLTKGVVVSGDVVLGVADVDLVYLRVSAVLAAADRIMESMRPRVLPRVPKRKRRFP
jgi:hypothetical protein